MVRNFIYFCIRFNLKKLHLDSCFRSFSLVLVHAYRNGHSYLLGESSESGNTIMDPQQLTNAIAVM